MAFVVNGLSAVSEEIITGIRHGSRPLVGVLSARRVPVVRSRVESQFFLAFFRSAGRLLRNASTFDCTRLGWIHGRSRLQRSSARGDKYFWLESLDIRPFVFIASRPFG